MKDNIYYSSDELKRKKEIKRKTTQIEKLLMKNIINQKQFMACSKLKSLYDSQLCIGKSIPYFEPRVDISKSNYENYKIAVVDSMRKYNNVLLKLSSDKELETKDLCLFLDLIVFDCEVTKIVKKYNHRTNVIYKIVFKVANSLVNCFAELH